MSNLEHLKLAKEAVEKAKKWEEHDDLEAAAVWWEEAESQYADAGVDAEWFAESSDPPADQFKSMNRFPLFPTRLVEFTTQTETDGRGGIVIHSTDVQTADP